MAVKRRSYTSPVRTAQAAQTRASIVAAAARLFESNGYAATSIRQVAGEAGVAEDTVYATFKTKPRLLTAVIDLRLSAGTGVRNVMERAEALAVRDETDQRRQIKLLAADLANVVGRVGPVFEMMRSAATIEPTMADVYAEMQGYRRRNMHTAIGWIAARGRLRVDVETATDTLWICAAPDTHRMLTVLQGWTSDHYRDWLEDTLSRTLLRDAGTPPKPRRASR